MHNISFNSLKDIFNYSFTTTSGKGILYCILNHKRSMNKKILLVIGLLALGIVGAAVISSYGSITGYATVEQAITIDIMGSSNDENYTLSSAHQGETKYSPEIKLVNDADVPIRVNVTAGISPGSIGNESDVKLNLVNEFKNETLTNPITVLTTDYRFYLEHNFSSSASLGNYSFKILVTPS